MERFKRFRFSVPAVPLQKGGFCISVQFNRKGRFRFRFRFLENGSGGSGSTFPEGPRIEKKSISRGNIEKIKLSIRNEIFNREWFFHSGPLSGRRKTGPGIEIFNREWNFQTENEDFKREWKFRAWGNGFFMRSSENDFFRSPGPLGLVSGKTVPTVPVPGSGSVPEPPCNKPLTSH